MTRLLILRHAATSWNEERRIQGRTDRPLSPTGRAAARRWRVPSDIAVSRWLASPLRRAAETARLMGLDAALEHRLIEMAWGQWEGERLPDLRTALGAAMAANEARGLDFRPPQGESPRDVQHRLATLLADLAGTGDTVGAVTHKGVVRALYSLAVGWDMRTREPDAVDWDAAHLFRLVADGAPAVERLNIPLGGGG